MPNVEQEEQKSHETKDNENEDDAVISKTGESPVTEINKTNKRWEREVEPLIIGYDSQHNSSFPPLFFSLLQQESLLWPLLQHLRQRKHLHGLNQEKEMIVCDSCFSHVKIKRNKMTS